MALIVPIVVCATLPSLPGRMGVDLLVPAILLCVAVAARSFRVRLAFDGQGLTVVNYWRTRRFRWDEVAEVTTAWSPDFLSGRRIAIRTYASPRPVPVQAGILVGRDAEAMIASLRAEAAGRGIPVSLPGSA